MDLATGGTITVEIRANAAGAVVPGETINNVATTTWTSLDGDFSTRRTANNTSSTERSGADGVGADGTVLNNYAAANSTSTGQLIVAIPVLNKTIVASSESHTLQNRVLADFTATSFDALAGSWSGQVTAQPQFVQIAGTATSSGSGTLTFGTAARPHRPWQHRRAPPGHRGQCRHGPPPPGSGCGRHGGPGRPDRDFGSCGALLLLCGQPLDSDHHDCRNHARPRPEPDQPDRSHRQRKLRLPHGH